FAEGTVTLTQNTLKVQPGRNVPFSCQVTDGESFVAWITPAKAARPGKPGIPSVSITTSQTTGRRRISVSGVTYTLFIDSVTVDDGGDYICQGESNSAVFTLEVDFRTDNVITKQELLIGQNGTIMLDVSSYPLPTYQWSKDGNPLTFPTEGKTLDKYTGSIIIDNVKQSDEGNYSCTITFGFSETVRIEVIVIDPPSINKEASPTPVYSIVGNRKPVTVTCSFYGKPVPTVIMVAENGTEIARGNSLASYVFTTTTENDFGKFNCSAENPHGKAEYMVELRKADEPQI
ncbi:fasciclin-2-like, partial [Oculina patagonica]